MATATATATTASPATATTASPAADDRPPAPAPGPAARWIARLFFRAAEVTDNRPLGGGLHCIGLEGPALRGLAWAPGDKLQVRLGNGLQTRTYTPIRWDAQHGRTELVAHALAAGPGSEWARQAAPGQAVSLLGPRRALNLAGLDPEHSVVVGDETTVALAAAWRPAHALFEAANAPAVHAALAAVGVHGSALPTRPDDAHLDELTRAVLARLSPDTAFVLTGRARTVPHLLRALRREGVPASRLRAKAHWAEGKAGLD